MNLYINKLFKIFNFAIKNKTTIDITSYYSIEISTHNLLSYTNIIN